MYKTSYKADEESKVQTLWQPKQNTDTAFEEHPTEPGGSEEQQVSDNGYLSSKAVLEKTSKTIDFSYDDASKGGQLVLMDPLYGGGAILDNGMTTAKDVAVFHGKDDQGDFYYVEAPENSRNYQLSITHSDYGDYKYTAVSKNESTGNFKIIYPTEYVSEVRIVNAKLSQTFVKALADVNAMSPSEALTAAIKSMCMTQESRDELNLVLKANDQDIPQYKHAYNIPLINRHWGGPARSYVSAMQTALTKIFTDLEYRIQDTGSNKFSLGQAEVSLDLGGSNTQVDYKAESAEQFTDSNNITQSAVSTDAEKSNTQVDYKAESAEQFTDSNNITQSLVSTDEGKSNAQVNHKARSADPNTNITHNAAGQITGTKAKEASYNGFLI